ncbi:MULTISPECIES: lipopolysaccharide heptosyltransferase I [Methylomonas]|uniref:Lipopolysaccharide heptosyltransferase 1 n=2 Tax=Methylomonas TaxID=416 RepID=A0A126T1Y2_9GAMM|nr:MULTISPECIES: lipopolysaccharide heptosyltransferase I [Methylomonas]AMK76087.1 lipopolysaccharide heptosyltransferase I [Methylomonas denitrificans]OAH99787.1 lipopolysaccharide heptosyltransferase I [Methylomonas methanica]TCV83892.1 heptosyltransferase-1 [Methylomonas methanica]
MKIAIVKLSALGDIVHAMAALQFIKAALPLAQIDWIVEERFAGVLADNPHLDNVLGVNLKALKTDKWRIFAEINKVRGYAEQGYDLVIDAQGLIKSALVARLLSANCVGFDQDSIREKWAALFYNRHVTYPYDANTIDRNVAVLTQPLGLNVTPAQIQAKQPFLYFQPPQTPLDEYFPTGQPNIILVIGSTWLSRNYPLEKFLQVIFGLEANFLICWGNEKEHWMAQWLAERSLARVLPQLSLNDLKAALARADLVIGNDTGPTHMAWGLNRPSITLFGPTPISRVYQTDINKVLKSPSHVNPFKLDKNDFSIAEIDPRAAIALSNELFGKTYQQA